MRVFSGKYILLLLSATLNEDILLSARAGPVGDFLVCVRSGGHRAVTVTSNSTGASCSDSAVGAVVPV